MTVKFRRSFMWQRMHRPRTKCPHVFLVTSVFLCSTAIHFLTVFNSDTSVANGDNTVYRHRFLLSVNESKKGNYPDDVFTLAQKRKGAVILHIIGMCYMFLALSIACDEFFIPALAIITEKLNISEDVAGATFMAAGGSMPELCTSFIGVFADPDSNVGFGTIVGSAVFNVLFVIGMCAVFSKEILKLTWWPLFRDCMFYSIALIVLIVFFTDGKIEWWEALILIITYFLYVTFMKYNHKIERSVKRLLKSNKVSTLDSKQAEAANMQDPSLEKAVENLCTSSKQNNGLPCFRHGALQLVIHTMDPLGEGNNFTSINDSYNKGVVDNSSRNSSLVNGGTLFPLVQIAPHENGAVHVPGGVPENCERSNNAYRTSTEPQGSQTTMLPHSSHQQLVDVESAKEACLEDESEPIDLSWPSGWKDRLVYLIRAPIMYCMYFTALDIKRPERRHLYPWTFIWSMLWIVCFSYLMVWWATEVGDTLGIPTEVMGLTFLAAGTSIPDLITSVLVARKGFGDMAVSSSIGSNLFDVTIGLPVPWIIFSAVHSGTAMVVSSSGLFCSVLLLFLMLIAVVAAIAISKWKMSKLLGATMFVLYVVFLVLSLLLQYNEIKCPF
ncbi:sodium/potassium/calcium exchanger 2-like isoform X3 [Orbicella faveolata]|uniref:sodium/potassium/calcium exchanger 2-like isoform X3 n=1 Tax=Orbicella faveolata TaxID=48498 RepID=UPI0009E60747|nr:sodium/potassium/calcium exchanger 2-like isoform X3 [Orbicella faveolata]